MKTYEKPTIHVVRISQCALLTASADNAQGLKDFWDSKGITNYDAQNVIDGDNWAFDPD